MQISACSTLLLVALSAPLLACSDGPDEGANKDGGPTNVDPSAIFPSDNLWNRDVSGDDVDPDSAKYIASIGAGAIKADFSNFVNGGFGIPYVVVPGDQKKVPIHFTDFGAQSDPGPYPMPLDVPIEGMGKGDAHAVAVDLTNKKLYELYIAKQTGDGFDAASGAVFDLSSNAERPEGWTSADAAGLPIFPGLVRADEVIGAGEIKHALRFTVQKTQKGYVAPARHFASSSTDAALPPMGLRVRLKKDVDISGVSPQAKIILVALKKFGMIVADNGSNWFISGAPDARWDDDDLHTIAKIKGSDFEVVKHGPIGMLSP